MLFLGSVGATPEHLHDYCCCSVSLLVLVMVPVGIVFRAAFTSTGRSSEGTWQPSFGIHRGLQVSSWVTIFLLRSAALVLRLLVSVGAWYPISGCGVDDHISPLTCRPGSPLP